LFHAGAKRNPGSLFIKYAFWWVWIRILKPVRSKSLKSLTTWVQCCPSRVLTYKRGFLCTKLLNQYLPDKCSSKKHWLTVRKNVKFLCTLALES
jgi:hypothetical protein